MSRTAVMIALGLAATIGSSAPAAAFNPFDEPVGYQMPDRLKRQGQASGGQGSRAEGRTKPAPTANQRPVRNQQSIFFQSDDEDDLPPRPQSRKPEIVRGPPVLDGGGQPAISPIAPPVVQFPNSFGNGSIVIDTSSRTLYYILSSTTAYRYPISVGREGFTWTGTERISRVASWPDWRPPAEMKERQPNLPDLMTGGVRNPLGARALYLGNSLYRIHGTNDQRTIGQAASSGCFRMMNAHVVHLSGIAGVGTTVRVLSSLPRNIAAAGSKRG